ncbi:helix-turn-helix domain-containing protein [Pollutimonas sp. M17]|nr:helix-turn-helix domain-containing protein [Pollutimonas sp. M17]
MNDHFADRLRRARILRGMSQSALARACGLSQGAIANYENKTRQTAKGIFRLAEALRVNPAWLAQGIGPMETGQAEDATHSTYQLADPAQAGRQGLWPFTTISPDVYWALSHEDRSIVEATLASMIRSFQEKPARS